VKEPFDKIIDTILSPKTLLITCGLPGTWKTETAEKVSKIKGFPILRSDIIRLEVLKNDNVFDPKVAGNMKKRLSVYDEVLRRADELTSKSEGGLILDATFVSQDLRRRAAEVAAKHGLDFVIMETNCPQEVSFARIERRTKEKYESNALTIDAYLANKQKFEPVDIADIKQRNPNLKILHLKVDTCHDNPEDWYVIGMEKR
jgi:predicted kinase